MATTIRAEEITSIIQQEIELPVSMASKRLCTVS
jgi:hypothetical protein